ncbi:ferredoxin [Haladaptatus paucihalophilus DX253]|uniref:Ferredoxin n=1 Tax=Haladaptatus paucihalophilus DX253 TaxID=797209 RepID=E7QS58_HALPU|nr:2Fe-2S iron-sulfur cluster-binding protein [Haladaptatus paucihalophilus]EFW92827.1 ferredoxin [Haladaptatus paucihalophilus DX253]SHK11587.1 ferredoxin [Haladaptatus paucihalophilus DX253]
MTERDGTAAERDGDGDRHRVELRWRGGGTETVRAAAAESVLEAAERADIGLPFGCRTGACATCTGRLLSGKIEHEREPRALKTDSLADGYVLLCIARPKTDCRIEVGTDVHSDLVTNPWK